MTCEWCNGPLSSSRARYCSAACKQAAYRSRFSGGQEVPTLDSELRELRSQLEALPREAWTVDDRNALMALSLYFDSGSMRGQLRPLQNCSAPAVQDILIAEEMRAMVPA